MSAPISSHTIIGTSSQQVASDLDGAVVLLNFETGMYYGFEGVGARVWNLVQEPRSVAEIRDTLVQEYDVDSQRCEQDVLELLERALKAGLVEVKQS